MKYQKLESTDERAIARAAQGERKVREWPLAYLAVTSLAAVASLGTHAHDQQDTHQVFNVYTVVLAVPALVVFAARYALAQSGRPAAELGALGQALTSLAAALVLGSLVSDELEDFLDREPFHAVGVALRTTGLMIVYFAFAFAFCPGFRLPLRPAHNRRWRRAEAAHPRPGDRPRHAAEASAKPSPASRCCARAKSAAGCSASTRAAGSPAPYSTTAATTRDARPSRSRRSSAGPRRTGCTTRSSRTP